MPMVAHRRSSGIDRQILNISTSFRWVISSMIRLLYFKESGPFPTINTVWWAPGLVQTGRRKRKSRAPHWGSNPTVQPVVSHYTIYAIPPASHTEGDGMAIAHRRGKNHESIIHKDLRDINSTFAFQYLMIHVCISFLSYIKHSKNKMCTVESYVYF